MQNRAIVASLLFATFSGVFFAAACSDSGDNGATAGAGVETPDGAADTGADVTVTPLNDGATFDDRDATPPTGDDDDSTPGDGGTCLVQDPIDETTDRYVQAAPVEHDVCTEDELQDFITYYEANVQKPDFSVLAWEKVLSAKCRGCVFIDDGLRNATIWRPVVYVGDAIDVIDVGGCAEHLSGSTPCGKAFQQYEDCQNDACITKCTTQADYAACRADPLIFTTACKAATDAVVTACGSQTVVNEYELQCNYGTTFEGPIRVGCMADADAGVDAGDAGDAGSDGGDAGDAGGT